jgi:hypothetical protein
MHTQRERTLYALEEAGENGLTMLDFMPPNVVDHGPPIIRSQTRIFELKQEGWIMVNTKEKREKCDVYVLKPSPMKEEVQRDTKT